MSKIIIEDKNGYWLASWSDKEDVATGSSPNAALKMLLKMDETKAEYDSKSVWLESTIADLIDEHAKKHPYHKQITDLINVHINRNYDSTHDVALTVVAMHRFILDKRQIDNSNYIEHLTEWSLHKIMRLFDEICVNRIKDSSSSCKFGEFYMAANSLVPEDVLFMHPHTYRDLSLFGSKMGIGMYY